MQPLTTDLVLALVGRNPNDVKVVGLTYADGLGLATIVSNDDREDLVDTAEFRWVEPEGWGLQELGMLSGHTVVAGGFPGHPGGPLRAPVQGRKVEIEVSAGGWYGLITAVEPDVGGPVRKVTFPDYE